jgi:hypothetical protein
LPKWGRPIGDKEVERHAEYPEAEFFTLEKQQSLNASAACLIAAAAKLFRSASCRIETAPRLNSLDLSLIGAAASRN